MRYFRFLLVFLILSCGTGAGALWLVYQHYSRDLPDFEALKNYAPPIVTRIHAGDGTLLAEYAREKRVFVPIKVMPPRVISAVLAAEDREFYQHPGVDFEAVLRAAVTNLLRAGSGHRQVGASTITQQVTRLFLLSNEYSYVRKIKEMILALRLEQALTKDQILELYLNAPDFGHGAFGIAEASLTYFNKPLDDLSIAEEATLAGMLKGPSYYDPIRHPDRAKERRDYVIDGMLRIGAITQDEATAALATPIELHKRGEADSLSAPYPTEEVRRDLMQRFGEQAVYQGGLSVRTSIDPTLQQLAEKSLRDGLMVYDRRHGWRGPIAHVDLAGSADWRRALAGVPAPAGASPWKTAIVLSTAAAGLKIGIASGETGLIAFEDLGWARPTLPDQHVGGGPRSAADVAKAGDIVLVEPMPPPTADDKHPAAKPKIEPEPRYVLRQIPNVSGAIVAMDPHTGRVLALTGGWSFEMSQFDRAVQAKRQIGSTFKPFAYLAALENGMTPSTLIEELPVSIDMGPDQPRYEPRNFEGEEGGGPKTLRYAIEHSVNTMTVRMASTIGIDKIAPYVERLGIMDHMPLEYSMVLGAGETTLLRLTSAYSMLVNGGRKIVPSMIDRVQDRLGQTIYKHDTRDCPRCGDPDWAPDGAVPPLPDVRAQVLDPGTAYQMVNILEGVVKRGTGAAIGAHLRMPLAGKTGTTNGPNDTWFVGFSPDLAVGIYIGFDEPRALGPHEQGASVSAPVFEEFMGAALKGKPPIEFRIPPGIRLVRVNLDTGKLADPDDSRVIWEAFKPGTEPVSSDQEETVVEGGPGFQTLAVGGEAGDQPVESDGSAQTAPPVATAPPPPPPATGNGLY